MNISSVYKVLNQHFHTTIQVAKQWHDYDRSTFNFVKKLKESQHIQFNYGHDFDKNGILFWIGTNAK